MLIGYILITTHPETFSLQQHALQQAGCERLILDEVKAGAGATRGGARFAQPGLQRAMSLLRPGDTLVVCRLARLGRSFQDVAQTITELGRRGIGVRSLREEIDTTGSQGQHQLAVFSALAEFEHTLMQERVIPGIRSAQAQGQNFGRKRAMTPEKVKLASQLRRDSSLSVNEICRRLDVSRSTLFRYVGPKGEIRKA